MPHQRTRYDPKLKATLKELSEAKVEVREEGYLFPSKLALNNAEKLLIDLHQISPRLFSVYPTEDGEIATAATGGYRRSILILCDSDGGVFCSVTLMNECRQKQYPNAATLPDDFIKVALAQLAA